MNTQYINSVLKTIAIVLFQSVKTSHVQITSMINFVFTIFKEISKFLIL